MIMKTTKELFKIGNLSISETSAVFKYCPEGVVIKNSNLEYIIVNNSYCRIFGLSDSEKIIGSSNNECLSDKNIQFIKAADSEVKESKRPFNYIINIDNNRILSISTSPVIYSDEFIGLISIVKDITQEESIKEKFVDKHFQYITKEKQLQAQRENFVASIGHDLKNPTIAQIRSLELLLKGSFGAFTSEQKEILELVLDSCRYMYGMLSSLLATYRNYGGAIKLNFEEFNFVTLVSECVSEMLYVAKDKGVNIITDTPDSELIVSADKVQIKRVIMNLLSNGIKYAFKDTALKLCIKVTKERLFFWFENRSPYITEEKQKSLFAKYVSYKSVNKELGIGLGLYSSRKIIKGHSGRMFVKSFKEDKNIFGFNIPLIQNQSSNVEIAFN